MRTPLSVDNRGFTLMEVIVVLILMAIFAVLAVSRQPHTDMTLRAGAEVLKSHLRYAQMRAMSSDSGWGISYDSDTGDYWLISEQVTVRRINLPGENQNSVDLISKGISIDEGDFTLIFDHRGRPDITAPTLTTLSFDAGTRSAALNLVKSGEPNAIITILQNTGFIQ